MPLTDTEKIAFSLFYAVGIFRHQSVDRYFSSLLAYIGTGLIGCVACRPICAVPRAHSPSCSLARFNQQWPPERMNGEILRIAFQLGLMIFATVLRVGWTQPCLPHIRLFNQVDRNPAPMHRVERATGGAGFFHHVHFLSPQAMQCRRSICTGHLRQENRLYIRFRLVFFIRGNH